MNTIMSSYEQDILTNNAKLRNYYTWDYLKDTTDENYQYLKDKFFKTDSMTQLMNVGSWIFTVVPNTLANYVWDPKIDFSINLCDSIKDFVIFGYSLLVLIRDQGELKVEYIQSDNYVYYNQEHRVYTLYLDTNNEDENYYILKQVYWEWYIDNELYKLPNQYDYKKWDRVPLNTLKDTSNLQDKVVTGLDINTLFVTKDTSAKNIHYPQSILEKIVQLTYSVDRKIAMFESEFLKHTSQYTIFKNIAIPDYAIDSNWLVDIDKVGRIVATNDEVWGIEFVNNQNQLIEKALEYEEKQIRKIAWITGIPVDFFGIKHDTWAISWTSRSILQGAFIKAIKEIRDRFTKTLEQILIVLIEEWQLNLRWDKTELKIFFEDVIPKSDTELVEELATAREAKIISRFTAIQRYLWFTDQDTDMEVSRINEDLKLITKNEQITDQQTGSKNTIQGQDDEQSPQSNRN